MMKVSARKTFWVLYYLICSIGLIYQSKLIIEIYLQYKVSSSIDIAFPSTITPGTASICTRYTDVLDFKRLNQESNRNWNNTLQPDVIRRYQHELTIEEVFKFTPSNDDIIERVVFKTVNGSLTTDSKGSDPYRYIVISKYVYLEYICYMISLKARETWTFHNFAVTLVEPGLIFQVDFAESLATSRYLKFSFTNQHYDYPARSIMLSPVFYRDLSGNIVENDFISSHYRMFTKRLPYPHETNCVYYETMSSGSLLPRFDHDIDCAQMCMYEESVKRIKKYPYSVLIINSTTEKMVSYLDMMDKTIGPEVVKIESECKHKCRWAACHDGRIITTTDSKQGKKFRLNYILPTHPDIEITASAHLSFVEFVTYLISTISTWTGLSIIAMNPLEFIIKTWTKLKIHDRKRQRLQRQNETRRCSKKIFQFCLLKSSKTRNVVDQSIKQTMNNANHTTEI